MDTRRSFKALRGALDVAIVDKEFTNAKDEHKKVSEWRGCTESGCVWRRKSSRAMNDVISNLKILKGNHKCPGPTRFLYPRKNIRKRRRWCDIRYALNDNPKQCMRKHSGKSRVSLGPFSSRSNPLNKPNSSSANLSR